MKTSNAASLFSTLLFLNVFDFGQSNPLLIDTSNLKSSAGRTARDIQADVLASSDDLQALVSAGPAGPLPSANNLNVLLSRPASAIQAGARTSADLNALLSRPARDIQAEALPSADDLQAVVSRTARDLQPALPRTARDLQSLLEDAKAKDAQVHYSF